MWLFILFINLGALYTCAQIRSRALSSEDFQTFNCLLNANSTLYPTSTYYKFLHIAECGGASFMTDSPRLMKIGDTLKGNRE